MFRCCQVTTLLNRREPCNTGKEHPQFLNFVVPVWLRWETVHSAVVQLLFVIIHSSSKRSSAASAGVSQNDNDRSRLRTLLITCMGWWELVSHRRHESDHTRRQWNILTIYSRCVFIVIYSTVIKKQQITSANLMLILRLVSFSYSCCVLWQIQSSVWVRTITLVIILWVSWMLL